MALSVRFAAPSDVAAIVEVANWAAEHTAANFATEPETLESWMTSFQETSPRYPWLIAEDDARHFLGFAKAGPWKGRCAYAWAAESTVYVEQAATGQGVGRALMERLIEVTAEQGYRTLLAGITVPNPASVGLHEALGFRRVATFERIGYKFGEWHDVGYWQRALGDEVATAPGPVKPLNRT